MILNSNVSLVHGRGTGITKLNKLTSLGLASNPTSFKRKLLNRAASTNQTTRA